MTRGLHRGLVRAVATMVLVVLTGLATVLVGLTLPTASAQESAGGAKRFGACLAAQKTGDLLLLFDESSSLQQSDPQGARVQAARYLLQTLGRYVGRVDADLEVASAGFSDTYTPEHDWTRLTDANADPADEQTDRRLGESARHGCNGPEANSQEDDFTSRRSVDNPSQGDPSHTERHTECGPHDKPHLEVTDTQISFDGLHHHRKDISVHKR